MTRKNSLLAVLAAFTALLSCGVACAQATPIECPSTLQVKESAELANLEGWRTYDTSQQSTHNFYDIGFSEGPPEKLVFQNPSKSTSTKLKKVDQYDFTRFKEDIWIFCLYRDTSQSLTRKLEKRFSRCEVAYDEKTGFQTVKRIECF